MKHIRLKMERLEKMEKEKYRNKLYILLMILSSLCVFITYGGGSNSFYAIIFYSLSYSVVVISGAFIVIYNAINIFKNLNNNYEILCRFKNLKEYYNSIVKAVLKSNLQIIIKYIVIIAIASALGCVYNFTIPTIDFYNIPFLLYLAYYLIKFIIIMSLIGIIVIPVYSMLKNTGTVILLLLVVMSSLINPYYEGFVIDNISKFPINFISYLSMEQYSLFLMDVIAFLLYISVITLIIRILIEIIMKKRKDIL